jgi:hypothetical protein
LATSRSILTVRNERSHTFSAIRGCRPIFARVRKPLQRESLGQSVHSENAPRATIQCAARTALPEAIVWQYCHRSKFRTGWRFYAATGLCCGIDVILSIPISLSVLYRERAWVGLSSAGDALRFVPKTWWRWQKRYLLSTPVTLVIVVSFAATLSWA